MRLRHTSTLFVDAFVSGIGDSVCVHFLSSSLGIKRRGFLGILDSNPGPNNGVSKISGESVFLRNDTLLMKRF